MPDSRRISLPHLLLLLPWIAVVAKGLKSVTDNSYIWHIQAGHVQRDLGVVLTVDPFSFTMTGESWLTQSWLAELLYSVSHDWFGIGFTGVMVIVAGSLALVTAGLIAHGRSSSIPATAVVMGLTALMLLSFIVPRPVLFSYPLFAMVVLVWDRPALRWSLPFLMWTWASVHGSFAIGLAYIGLMVIVGKEWRAWPFVLVSGAVTLVTAHGIGVVQILAEFVTARPYLDFITEWRTPDFLDLALVPFAIGLILIIYGSMKGRLVPAELWVIVPFMFLAFSATRAVGTAWIALIPLLAASLRKMEWSWGRGFPVPVAGVAAAVIVLIPLVFAEPVALDPEFFPLEATGAMADVRTFHDDVAGGYLIYADEMSDGVFIDDRAELYRERIEEFVKVRAMREPWAAVFERDRIEQALLRSGEALVTSLQDAGWVRVFEDDHFVVLRPS